MEEVGENKRREGSQHLIPSVAMFITIHNSTLWCRGSLPALDQRWIMLHICTAGCFVSQSSTWGRRDAMQQRQPCNYTTNTVACWVRERPNLMSPQQCSRVYSAVACTGQGQKPMRLSMSSNGLPAGEGRREKKTQGILTSPGKTENSLGRFNKIKKSNIFPFLYSTLPLPLLITSSRLTLSHGSIL